MKVTHNNIQIVFTGNDKNKSQIGFNPSNIKNIENKISSPNFQLSIAGKLHGTAYSAVQGATYLPLEMEIKQFTQNEGEIILEYYHEELKLKAIVNMELVNGVNIIRQKTKVINEGNENVVLTHLSSAYVQGIALDGIRKWHDPEKIRIHYCRQTWHGEGQWRSDNLENLGLYPANQVANSGCAVKFSSIGSYSTGNYLPMAIIEDLETNQVWYFQIENSSSWYYEIGYKGIPTNDDGSLFIHTSCNNERHGFWNKALKPGESFESPITAIGCCIGGFEQAIGELTKYRRESLKPDLNEYDEMPVIFNDYMNCLCAEPTRERLIPLIDRAAEIGAEVFCIDAGWFGEKEPAYGWGMKLGDWEPSKDRFGEEGLQGVIDYIKKQNMIPGIWLEMECVGVQSKLFKKPDSWFLIKGGKRVGGGSHHFLKFSNPEVRQYMGSKIEMLYNMGIRYIKNDYNNCVGIGDDEISQFPGDGLLTNTRAFYSFIDEIRYAYPDMIMENCGSGAMREDYGILSHFHLQSISDQDNCYRYPSIISGSLAAVLPEQLGIWSLIYPIPHLQYDKVELLETDEYKEKMRDGERTIFNIVNGLCGNLYLSGHIDYADEKNIELVKQGIQVYKQIKNTTHNSYPIWPSGRKGFNDNGWHSVGLKSEDEKEIYLAVWRLGTSKEYFDIQIQELKGKEVVIEQIYPEPDKDYQSEFYFSASSGKVTISYNKPYTARFFRISLN